MQIAAAMSRLGTESAFEVLARARSLPPRGARSSTSASASPISARPSTSSRPASRRCATAITAIPRRTAFRRCAQAVAADLHRRHGVEVNPDNVVVVPGGKPTMFFAMLMFGEPGAEIMYPNPGFPIYESVIRFSGATPVPIPLKEENGFAFDAEDGAGPDHAQRPG